MRAILELPGGLWVEPGRRVAEAELRPLTGSDEEWLAGLANDVGTAEVVTGLLERCLTRLGDEAPPSTSRIGDLLVGDREYLLLGLRRLTFGSQFDAVMACPACGSKMDLAFEADDIPVERRPQTQARFQADLRRQDGSALRVAFHLPRGTDQEAAAKRGEAHATEALVASCVDAVDGQLTTPEVLAALDLPALAELDHRMEELAPRVDLSMELTCPECGHLFSSDLDLAPFLLEEMRASAGQLVREVHGLALHYHWSEPDILALPRAKRRAYLELVSETLQQGAAR